MGTDPMTTTADRTAPLHGWDQEGGTVGEWWWDGTGAEGADPAPAEDDDEEEDTDRAL